MDQQFISRLEFCASTVGSVAALARKADISQSGIRKYYQGTEPTRPVLLALSKAAGVKLLWLADGGGPVCDLDSPLLASAKQELVKNFHFARQANAHALVLIDALRYYCEEYNHGRISGSLPDYVQVIIPKLYWQELGNWTQGDFSTPPKCWQPEGADEAIRAVEGWLQAPADLVVAVARELPLAFGDEYSNLDRRKETHVLRAVVDFLRQQSDETRKSFMSPEVLRSQIQFAAHMFDKGEKGQQGDGKSITWVPGDY